MKPLIKECIKEVIFEEGTLSTIISEVMKGTSSNKVDYETKQKQSDLVIILNTHHVVTFWKMCNAFYCSLSILLFFVWNYKDVELRSGWWRCRPEISDIRPCGEKHVVLYCHVFRIPYLWISNSDTLHLRGIIYNYIYAYIMYYTNIYIYTYM